MDAGRAATCTPAAGCSTAIAASTITLEEAGAATLAFIKEHVPEPGTVPLCGNSIGTDRRFLAAYLPEIEELPALPRRRRVERQGAREALVPRACGPAARARTATTAPSTTSARASPSSATTARRRSCRVRPLNRRRSLPGWRSPAVRSRSPRPTRSPRSRPACCACSCRSTCPGSATSTATRSRTSGASRSSTPACPARSRGRHLVDRLDRSGAAARPGSTPSIVTHSHPDHFGGAGRVRHEVGAEHRHPRAVPHVVGPGRGRTTTARGGARHPWARPTPWGGERVHARPRPAQAVRGDAQATTSSRLPDPLGGSTTPTS